jgi:hypothetical protein
MTAARRVAFTRAYLATASVAGAALVWFALAALGATIAAALATVAAAAVLWWWRGVFSRQRVVLWLEERVPALRYSLAALVDAPDTRFRPILERSVNDARFGRALALAGLKLVGIPALLLLSAHLMARPIIAKVASASREAGVPGARRGGRDVAGDARLRATVTPPAYARMRTTTLDNPTSIAALVGSDIRFGGGWSGHSVMPARPAVIRLEGAAGARLVALEPRADSAPRVVLELPARDTVLPSPTGTIRLDASARDDIGVASGWFEVIVSSGTGELFKFRTGILGRTAGNNERALRWGASLSFDSLELQPGDIVHLRAVARDANPAREAEAGSSETRTLRVFRVGEGDSVSVEGAPPPEVGRSELSQRMLIILTERLVAQTRTLARGAVQTEAQSIARDQSRLRRRVGEIIFTRLTGEDRLDEDAAAAIGDTVSPGEALLRAAEAATILGDEHAHDEGEVIGVNRPLLEAFNAMWSAERELGVVEPRKALPHMRAALAAIQRARAAERLYLRGKPPTIVLDLARIRLSGKREGIDPTTRAPGPSTVAPLIARRERFRAALDLLERDASAAIDTLLLVRVDALADSPRFAAALDAAIGALRAGRDATASLRAAWRSMAGEPSVSRAARWSGVW